MCVLEWLTWFCPVPSRASGTLVAEVLEATDKLICKILITCSQRLKAKGKQPYLLLASNNSFVH